MKNNFGEIGETAERSENSEKKVESLLKENEELKEKIRHIENLLTLDPLTEVYNRRYIEEELKTLFDEVEAIKQNKERRTGKEDQLSIIFLDIDDFKKVNDNYGHEAGDIVLKEVSGLIKRNIRSSDKVARYGGEEFIIVLVKASKEDAYQKAEHVRTLISQTKIKINTKDSLSVTVTLGVASLSNEKSIKELLNKADKVLYEGKKTGKNKTTIAE